MTVRKQRQRRRHVVSWDSRLSVLLIILGVAVVAAGLVVGSNWILPP